MNFDFNNVESETNNFEPMPVGNYKVVLDEMDSKDTKNGKGKYFNCKYKVLSPEKYNKRFVFDSVNYKNDSVQCVNIGMARIKRMFELCSVPVNKMGETKPATMVGKEFMIFVGHKEWNGKKQEKLSAFLDPKTIKLEEEIQKTNKVPAGWV